jgi:hypothetical protein
MENLLTEWQVLIVELRPHSQRLDAICASENDLHAELAEGANTEDERNSREHIEGF